MARARLVRMCACGARVRKGRRDGVARPRVAGRGVEWRVASMREEVLAPS